MTNKYCHDCDKCITKCDGKSKGVYRFKSDLALSEERENYLISQINMLPGFSAKKCELDGYPDIEVLHLQSNTKIFFEVKVQRRTFMSVRSKLPKADLIPSETVVLNLSDLVRYFRIRENEGCPTFIIWCLLERPCIVPEGEIQYYVQATDRLKQIYQNYGDDRRFRRQSGQGDVVNGQHKGVVVNYHFSLNELELLDFEGILRNLV